MHSLMLLFLTFSYVCHAEAKNLKKISLVNSNYELGFLTPDVDFCKGPNSTFILFEFINSKSNYNITLIFHEFYHHNDIYFCSTKTIRTTDVLLHIPLSMHSMANRNYKENCYQIDPICSPVYNVSAPGFLEVIKKDKNKLLSNKVHLIPSELSSQKWFNFTYEIRAENPNDGTLAPHRMDVNKMWRMNHCSLNGFPVLSQTDESWYEFKCDCKFNTYGDDCQWNSICQEKEARKLCNNHGICRAKGALSDKLFCECDEEYYGAGCKLHFTSFATSRDCQSETCHHCHILPNNETKCSCKIGYQLTESGICISLDQNASIIDRQVPLSGKDRHRKLCNSNLQHYSVKDDRLFNDQSNMRVETLSKDKSSGTLIETFYLTVHEKEWRFCCHSKEKDLSYTFYKDSNIINDAPLIPSEKKSWRRGSISLEYVENLLPCVCLKIENFTSEDHGVYKCQVENAFRKDTNSLVALEERLTLNMEPQHITVRKGENATITCNVKKESSLDVPLRTTWRVSPNRSTKEFDEFPVDMQTSKIILYNITKNLKVDCSSQDNVISQTFTDDNYQEKSIQINVITEIDKVCEETSYLNQTWPLTKIHNFTSVPCPMVTMKKAHCIRECSTVGEDFTPTWRVPDCSACERLNISIIFQNVTNYFKGIGSFLPNPSELLADLRQEFEGASSLLPGEGGSLLSKIRKIFRFHDFKIPSEDFFSYVDFLISSSHSVKEENLEDLQRLLTDYLQRSADETCIQKLFINPNLISLILRKSAFDDNNDIDVVIPLRNKNVVKREAVRTNDSNVYNIKKITEIKVKKTNKSAATWVSIHVFRHPHFLLPFWRRIVGLSSSKFLGISKTEFAQVFSPLIQTNVFGQASQEETVTVHFSPCILPQSDREIRASKYWIRCGRFQPEKNYWNVTMCSLKATANDKCICECKGLNGWIGLFQYENTENYDPRALHWQKNIVVAVSCFIAMFILIVIGVILFLKYLLYSLKVLPRLLEVIAIWTVNLLFFYCAIVETNEDEMMIVLMVVSGSLVLALGISVSHQVSVLNKCSEAIKNPRQNTLLSHPSYLLILVSTLVAVMLGGVLWIIVKVQKLRLSKAWLPKTNDSSLTLIVICYISSLLLLELVLGFLNWLRIKDLHRQISQKWIIDSLKVELRKYCIVAFFKCLFILTSFCQDDDIGKYMFAIFTITLSLMCLFFYTCEHFLCNSKSICSARSLSINERSLQADNETKRNSLRYFLQKVLGGSTTVYSGVAATETSHVPHDDSIEFCRCSSRWSQNSYNKNEVQDVVCSPSFMNNNSENAPPTQCFTTSHHTILSGDNIHSHNKPELTGSSPNVRQFGPQKTPSSHRYLTMKGIRKSPVERMTNNNVPSPVFFTKTKYVNVNSKDQEPVTKEMTLDSNDSSLDDMKASKTLSMPRSHKGRRLLSQFSSKLSLVTTISKRGSTKTNDSTDDVQANELILPNTVTNTHPKVALSQNNILKVTDHLASHRRQHSF